MNKWWSPAWLPVSKRNRARRHLARRGLRSVFRKRNRPRSRVPPPRDPTVAPPSRRRNRPPRFPPASPARNTSFARPRFHRPRRSRDHPRTSPPGLRARPPKRPLRVRSHPPGLTARIRGPGLPLTGAPPNPRQRRQTIRPARQSPPHPPSLLNPAKKEAKHPTPRRSTT
jgi:hypothetical protein